MPDTQTPWWSRDADELTRELGSGPAGLSSAEASARLRQFGYMLARMMLVKAWFFRQR